MVEQDNSKPNTFLELIVGLIYAALIIGCTVITQMQVKGFLDQFSVYVGALVVSFFSFLFAMIIGSIGKAVINFIMGDHFLSRDFVIFACIFLVIICFLSGAYLLVWWLTAIMSVIGTFITFIKKFVRKKVKTKVEEKKEEVKQFGRDVRQFEHDARHRSIDEARKAMDKMRGKR